MKSPLRPIACSLLFTLTLAYTAAAADLITDGNFSAVSVTATGSTVGDLFGQFGTDVTGSAAKNSTLTVGGWTTTGYNFVFTPGMADEGTNTGAKAGQDTEAPGQSNSGSVGNVYLWGSNNLTGGTVIPATNPAGGNLIAADGAYETAAIVQQIYNLTPGITYTVGFWYAAGQQYNFAGDTTEIWKVALGTSALTTTSPATAYQTTPVINLTSHTFSGWAYDTMNFTATSSSEMLSFLAYGTPSGEPPFSVLNGVTMDVVPEPSSWIFFAGVGTACTIFGVVRRRRRLARDGEGLNC